MSYYDPLYPIIQNTRNQIQHSIIALEEKLKQRRQIDHDIEHLMQEQIIRKNYIPQNPRPPIYVDPVSQAQLRYRSHLEDKLATQKIKYVNEEEDAAYLHMNRMDQLQRQKLQLSRQRLRQQYIHELQVEGKIRDRLGYIGYDDDQLLIKKYQDGTRVKEYNHDLESYGNTIRNLHESPQKTGRPINRSLASQFKVDSQKKLQHTFSSSKINRKSSPTSHNKRSPYARLDMDTEKKNESPIKEDDYLKQRRYQDKEKKNSEERTGFFKIPEQTSIGQRSGKKLSLIHENKSRQDISPYYKKGTERKHSKSQKNMSKSKMKSTYVDKSHSFVRSAEGDALKKIQNRLKLSQIVYEDSKFRNIKHELSHLHMTYEIEEKARKQIKDKLNNHPSILRKHAMVVE